MSKPQTGNILRPNSLQCGIMKSGTDFWCTLYNTSSMHVKSPPWKNIQRKELHRQRWKTSDPY